MFYSYLKELSFKLNPYDPCVANKMINGKQCTIAWYVDNTNTSHIDHKVVSHVIAQLEERFGEIAVKRGPEHVFLGMKIVYKGNGTAEIMMREYPKESIAESGLEVSRHAATPAKRDLFDLDGRSFPLSIKEAEASHTI